MAPLTLLSMPDEILLMVCANLCSHCIGDRIPCIPESFETPTQLALIKTCRCLRDVAQPFLYHAVCPQNSLKFLRSIVRRPDFAAQVCSFDNLRSWHSEPSTRDVKMFKAEARRLGIRNRDGWIQDILHDSDELYRAILEMTLAHLTNAKEVSIYNQHYRGEGLYELFKEPVMLKTVRYLHMNYVTTEDFAFLRSIISIMPDLKTLELGECEKIWQPLPLSGLRSLMLGESYLSAASLQILVDSCPELEHFEYEEGDKQTYEFRELRSFSWLEAQRILRSRGKTLKALSFEFGREYDPLGDRQGPGESLDDFRGFDVLETLWVRTTSFGTRNDDAGPVFPENVHDLVTKLPASLIRLGFCGRHKHWHGIETLAHAIQQGYFPRLEKVMLEQDEAEFEHSCQILAAVGVVCGRLTPKFYNSFPDGKGYVKTF